MEETHVSYETAKLATEKGFNEFDKNNNRVFCEIENSVFFHKPVQNNHEDSYNANYKYRCPTQSFLQTWLRDVHNIDLWFGMLDKPNKYHVEDILQDDIIIGGINTGSPTYEEALELGLQEALRLIGRDKSKDGEIFGTLDIDF